MDTRTKQRTLVLSIVAVGCFGIAFAGFAQSTSPGVTSVPVP